MRALGVGESPLHARIGGPAGDTDGDEARADLLVAAEVCRGDGEDDGVTDATRDQQDVPGTGHRAQFSPD